MEGENSCECSLVYDTGPLQALRWEDALINIHATLHFSCITS